SPRTWGERLLEALAIAVKRTIPTHVGRTVPRGQEPQILADHPHARGENGRCELGLRPPYGPSPRTWGEHSSSRSASSSRRTIPTHVGRTTPPPLFSGRLTDHPH